eukprot:CAMPEP_0172448204 /NCGR_PEP_ID=MMETSP1065-20121228/7265_1 /TAXON_ID=265537 /ORGANISM="Amphiprora paludosa, Strain CCMP125" /LENGTH=300 /DNA_ID=CAMNT_0013199631 /DNA_START=63 /DNA_END=965 /DNA_ORIENTATION=-
MQLTISILVTSCLLGLANASSTAQATKGSHELHVAVHRGGATTTAGGNGGYPTAAPGYGTSRSSYSAGSDEWSSYPRKVKRKVSQTYKNGSRASSSATGLRQQSGSVFRPLHEWWSDHISPNLKNLPKIQCRVEPTTTLKLRKTFRPLGTIVQLGADYGMQTGVWQFKSSWEDALIGGKLTLAGRELQFTKSWQLSLSAMEDLVTRLRLRAAVDLQTYKAYCRVGFRTERLAPINVMEGFTIQKQFPLDGKGKHIKVEVKSNFCLPEPEISYSTETQRKSLVGMGDIEINIDELNLLLDY